MHSKEIRDRFLKFFSEKGHQIVPSAPIIVRNDPTLMFTNAGMNQFKDLFLGNAAITHPRIADTQKCLRVSGKHNDLEEVGHDTYHHTMFEMLGNWSFGDYFKKEAIDWAWEFLTGTLGIAPENMYATVFEGSKEEKLEFDAEAWEYWKKHLPEDHIIRGSRKDNFWEMGDTGPCGPCSELHVDVRPEAERASTPGRDLVNTGNPRVIEIWNLVFIQYNRKSNGDLEFLPKKHVDTGMGFERLCRVVQQKDSNYDTDLFRPVIAELERMSGISYGKDADSDVAMRVVADHLRALSFCIADGQVPSNNKAGYVLRRILRRAVRYGHTFLHLEEPFIYKLVPVLAETMGHVFPELDNQKDLVMNVIREEEASFLRTLGNGIRRLGQIMAVHEKTKLIPGKDAFELYDTFGFPPDLTDLIAREKGFSMDQAAFETEMQLQKERSRSASAVDTGDWITVSDTATEGYFVGYDELETPVQITRYRKVKTKNKEQYQLVFDKTPFYAESGGQVGDTGTIEAGSERVKILDTQKENNLIIHIAEKLPSDPEASFVARVNKQNRILTANNHSATHLLHHALRKVLGTHVEQKGSLVEPSRLRFDFSHFQKMSEEEIRQVEKLVNEEIRKNHAREEHRRTSMEEAQRMGAMALFGEKYGEQVRVIRFGDSVELCGGIHVESTASIGFFKILSESAIAAGIRRIEAITADEADSFIREELTQLDAIRAILKNQKNPQQALEKLLAENDALQKQLETFYKKEAESLRQELSGKVKKVKEVNLIAELVNTSQPELLKDIAFQLKEKFNPLFLILGCKAAGKAHLALMISQDLIDSNKLNAGQIIREISKEIKGGGGGQPFFATAGGTDESGLERAISMAVEILKKATE
ncbi:MAG: alanine--tRNA ligase [Bacteroidales bacterium]